VLLSEDKVLIDQQPVGI